MASYPRGYEEERFATTVNRNFLCSICFNVLRDPMLCPKNQHCFCRACITTYLQNSNKCPTCGDQLTVKTLTEPSRIVKDYLNELNIHCKYVSRGCHETVQLQHLEDHETACGFTPEVCKNQGCGVTVNRRDLIHHESELCEFRKLKCHSCGEMEKTLADIEKRIATVERNTATNRVITERKLEKMGKNMATSMATIETKLENLERDGKENMSEIRTGMEKQLEAVNNEVRGLKAALIEGFNQMKDVLAKTADKNKENTTEARGRPSGDREKENIIVIGGRSAQIFNWRQRLWSPLHSLADMRYATTSFVYNDYLTITGGCSCLGFGCFENMIRTIIELNPDPMPCWSECPVKLPAKLGYHCSAVYNDQLIVSGGYNENLKTTSDCIHEVQLVPPYTVSILSRMPEPRREHSMEIYDGNLLIAGGRKSDNCRDTLSSVVLYDMETNECKQLTPLPYEVSQMATVRWRDNIVVIGGADKRGKALDSVIIYNVQTQQHYMLPPMKYKRRGCAAVVIANNIVVLGGEGERRNDLKSVEAFNFDRYTWEELPEMSEGRFFHTAVAV